ncbi:phage virion morphogenesis protein, partial [Escherichia coli]|nr:phage morphogenesis protein [Escherichia coli]
MDKAFTELDRKAQVIIKWAAPDSQARIAKHIAKELRRTQQARIRSQKAPDGTAWTPRRRRVTRIQERIRFIRDNEVRTLKNWHHDTGKYGRTITGWDEDKGGIRTFYRADILRFLEIRTRRINQDSTRRAPMFVKLRTARYLKARTDASGVTVGYSGVAARIA